MFTKHLTCSLLLMLCASASAQTAETPQAPTKTEQQEARERLEKKALALLEDALSDAQSLRQGTNRLRIQVIAADLIWSHDEARARALYEKSIKDYAELVGSLDTSDPNYYMHIQAPAQLYQEILQPLIRHDPQMALDFVRHVQPPQQPTQSDPRYVDTSYELQLETQIASQIVAKDPKLALQVGMESLNKGFSSNLTNLVSQLQEKDRDAASSLASAVAKKLLTENLLFNYDAANVAVNLLSAASSSAAHGSSNVGKPSGAVPLIDDQSYSALMELVINAALNTSARLNPADWREQNIKQALLNGIQNLMPQIEKYAPTRLSALKRKLADFNQTQDPWAKFWQDNQELFQKGSVDDILGLAQKVEPAMRNQVYQQAAWKAISQGDSERARQIISDNVSSPQERRQMLDNIDKQAAQKAASDGKLDQARAALSRLHTNEERAVLLTQLAAALASKGDKSGALRLLGEARSLVSNRAENFNQLQTQLHVAQSFAPLDPAQSFEMMEPIIAQFNDFLSAAEVLNGFDQQYYKDGELLWQTTTLSNLLFQTINDLGQLAPANFDHAKDVAGRFQRPEVRVMAELAIARAVLSDQRTLDLPISGRRVVSFSGGYVFQEF